MNNTLIDQLKLAIQVESGEVPLSEVERRLNADYVSTDNSRLVWHPAQGTHTPKHWNFREYEYRRKPKPLELWVNIREDGLMRCFDCIQGAIGDSRARAANDEIPDRAVAVHMREVTND